MLETVAARTEVNADCFRRMCHRVGYDTARRFVFCRRTDACRAYLKTAGDEAPDFCPNAVFFEAGAVA